MERKPPVKDVTGSGAPGERPPFLLAIVITGLDPVIHAFVWRGIRLAASRIEVRP